MNTITSGNARFSLLTDNVVRMEYSPSGQFEDKKSIRVLQRPDAIPFVKNGEEKGEITLWAEHFYITYKTGSTGFAPSSLRIFDGKSREEVWNPGTVDSDNLGFVHSSMDLIKPGLIPEGVHPASIEAHSVDGQWNWWSFKGKLGDSQHGLIGAGNADTASFDEILAEHPLEELPESIRELVAERSKYPPGLLSKSGYFLYNDSKTPLMTEDDPWITSRTAEEGYLDLYFFYYGTDFKKALKDYLTLFGPTPLLPRYSLGLWYSRYPTFNDTELKELIDTFESHELPLDMLVLDLEWHKYGWHGFDWDTDHIKNPRDFLAYLREKNIHTTFNIHPDGIPLKDSRYEDFLEASGITPGPDDISKDNMGEDYYVEKLFNFNVADKKHAHAFMDVLHKPVQDDGVDFWWIDGSAPVAGVDNLSNLLWTNHIYYSHIKKNYPERRPMIFSRTPGAGAHRYPFHFTGDTFSTWKTLENQVEQTLRAGHMGQSYITHDIGGHISSFLHIDPELYIRWVQFAVLSPIVRLHSSKQGENVGGERRPWLYGGQVLSSFKKAMELRMELLPYLYTLCAVSHTEGLPVCRSNFIENPDWEEGYDNWSTYYLGDRIYAAVPLEPGTIRKVLLPPGRWYKNNTTKAVTSNGKDAQTCIAGWHDTPLHFYKAGSLMIKQPYALKAAVLPDTLVIEIYCDSEPFTDTFKLYEDDGITSYFENGEHAAREFTVRADSSLKLTIGKTNGSYGEMKKKVHYLIKIIGRTPGNLVYNNKSYKARPETPDTFYLENMDTAEEHILEIK